MRVKTSAGWRRVSHVLRERAHGPVPAGCVVSRVDNQLPPNEVDRLEDLLLTER